MTGRETEFDREIAAWFETLKKPATPEDQARIDQIIDKMVGLPPRTPSERARLRAQQRETLYGREDVVATSKAITDEIDEGKLTVSALTAWRRHLFANIQDLTPSNKLLLDLPPIPRINPGLLAQTRIDEDQQLGPKVDAVLFTGDHLHSITLARRSLQIPQAMHDVLSTSLVDLQRLVSQKPGFGYRVTRGG